MSTDAVIVPGQLASERHQVALLGSETDGQLSIRVQSISPGEGTPLHQHLDQAETFHIVSGRFLFQVGEQNLEGEAGLTVHIPKGTPHCFLYLGEQPGKLISVLTPGVHDGFISQVPAAQQRGVSGAELTELAAQHGAIILGPGLKVTDAESQEQ